MPSTKVCSTKLSAEDAKKFAHAVRLCVIDCLCKYMHVCAYTCVLGCTFQYGAQPIQRGDTTLLRTPTHTHSSNHFAHIPAHTSSMTENRQVDHHYWYQLYLDDLPIWGMVGEAGEEHHGKKVRSVMRCSV